MRQVGEGISPRLDAMSEYEHIAGEGKHYVLLALSAITVDVRLGLSAITAAVTWLRRHLNDQQRMTHTVCRSRLDPMTLALD